jgi:hypothetical protein
MAIKRITERHGRRRKGTEFLPDEQRREASLYKAAEAAMLLPSGEEGVTHIFRAFFRVFP